MKKLKLIVNSMVCMLVVYSVATYGAVMTDGFTDNSTASRVIKQGKNHIVSFIKDLTSNITSVVESVKLQPVAYAETVNDQDSGGMEKGPEETPDKNSGNEAAPEEVADTGEYIIDNVPAISQFPELPTGCEATAASMLLKWYGVEADKVDIALAVPKASLPYYKNGKIYGSNPYEAFIGDPFSTRSYGVFYKPIEDIINKYLPGQAVSITGYSLESVLEVVGSGVPVIVWVTRDMKRPVIAQSWYDGDGNVIMWKAPEHTMVLIGFDKTHVILNNPSTGKTEKYSISLFKTVWEDMGSQAVTISI